MKPIAKAQKPKIEAPKPKPAAKPVEMRKEPKNEPIVMEAPKAHAQQETTTEKTWDVAERKQEDKVTEIKP